MSLTQTYAVDCMLGILHISLAMDGNRALPAERRHGVNKEKH